MPAYGRIEGLKRVGAAWRGRTILTPSRSRTSWPTWARCGDAAPHAVVLAWAPAAAARSGDAGTMRAAMAALAGGAPLRDGRVALEIAALVENGNAVPISVHVDSPMTAADHVREIAIFTERNPSRGGRGPSRPHSGRAEVATRIRLATSQTLVASRG